MVSYNLDSSLLEIGGHSRLQQPSMWSFGIVHLQQLIPKGLFDNCKTSGLTSLCSGRDRNLIAIGR
eukprot:5864733-Heterocapsa_arctica.AAC.1